MIIIQQHIEITIVIIDKYVMGMGVWQKSQELVFHVSKAFPDHHSTELSSFLALLPLVGACRPW